MADLEEGHEEEVVEEEQEEEEAESEETETEDEESEEQEEESEEQDDRPAKNYKAELARKNAEVERLQRALANKEEPVKTKKDPADITTWPDHELKMLVKSNDPSVAAFKDQAEEILFERKVKAIKARDEEVEVKDRAEERLLEEFPESADASSELSLKMQQVMREYKLHRTPAGRLAAAKIAASEMSKGKSTSDAKRRKNESDRVTRVKSGMVDGDRPKPTDTNAQKKVEEIEKGVLRGDSGAFKDALKLKGITRDSFFPKR